MPMTLTAASELLDNLPSGAMLLADKAYDANWLRSKLRAERSWANIPPKSNRSKPIVFSPWLYKKRNLIERFFNKLKYYRRVATRYDKLGMTFLAMAKLGRGLIMAESETNTRQLGHGEKVHA